MYSHKSIVNKLFMWFCY